MMDAVEFVKAMDRMCESHETCGECGLAFGKEEGCGSYIFDHPEEAVHIVEEWSKAHPIKTNGQKFVEVFGFVPTTWNKMGEEIHDYIADPQWWHEPYEAPKGDNNG